MDAVVFKRNKTTDLFNELNKFVYLFGLPNYGIEVLKLSKTFMSFYDPLRKVGNLCIYLLILSEYGALVTQKDLSEKQHSDMILFSISHTLIWGYRHVVVHYKHEVQHIMYTLGVVLKDVYNDGEIEERMIKRSKIFAWGLNFICFLSVVLYTIEAGTNAMTGGTFTILITAWPDVNAKTKLADASRVVCYIIWWIFMTRIFAVYMLVITLTVCLAHQYENLREYFYSINDIFDSNIEQKMKESKYEDAFKLGIKLHVETLRCTEQTQIIFKYVFSGQIIFNIFLLTMLMSQMVDLERTVVNAVGIVLTASTVLISTGVFMCNAGDVTVEAANIATAMYLSGWHNCTSNSSIRIRSLVSIAMTLAQKPVILTGLGIVELSYKSYVSIVKSSYSVFSVLY